MGVIGHGLLVMVSCALVLLPKAYTHMVYIIAMVVRVMF